jgi:hypothetical protein
MLASQDECQRVRTGSHQQRYGAKQRHDSLPHSFFSRHLLEALHGITSVLVAPSPEHGGFKKSNI